MKAETTDFLTDLIHGLEQRPRTLSPKYLYDERGSQLFERICELDEYYPTRTEIAILEANRAEIAGCLGSRCAVIEPGAGASVKTRILLKELRDPAAYVPIDVSGDFLKESSRKLAIDFPSIAIHPVCADFTQPLRIPRIPDARNQAVFFPGSTLGNFQPTDAATLLRRMRDWVLPEGKLLVGIDLIKDTRTLERAYNDVEGVTAEFNLNLLVRANRELGSDFDPRSFTHRATFDSKHSRIEMHLISKKEQGVKISGREFRFEAGESIHTENSYKYSLPRFRELASEAALAVTRHWTDPKKYFGIFLLEPTTDR